MKQKLSMICVWLVMVLAAYLWLAESSYALRHPEKTDAERFLRFKDVVFFR